jgi:Kdo2-lipid IVA lauroyltransferase/acyltransferase
VRTLSLRIVMLAVSCLPRAWRLRAIRRLAALRYRRYFTGIRPQAANLRDRLGVTPLEAEAILRRSFELELLAIVDGVRMVSPQRRELGSVIEIEGLDRLEAALEQGKGAVLTTGHVDGLTVFFTALGIGGYRPSLIRLRAHARKGRISRWLYERYNRRLERHGCKNLWMEPGGVGIGIHALRALRRNEVVISPIDLTQSTDNAVVTFFGGSALLPRGMALLAKTADAPLLDFFVHRGDDGRLIAVVGQPFHVTEVDAAVQHSTSALEAEIRLHPADWTPWHVFDHWESLQAEGLPSPSPRDVERPIAGA